MHFFCFIPHVSGQGMNFNTSKMVCSVRSSSPIPPPQEKRDAHPWGTPIYGLNRYVPHVRVWFLGVSNLEKGIGFALVGIVFLV